MAAFVKAFLFSHCFTAINHLTLQKEKQKDGQGLKRSVLVFILSVKCHQTNDGLTFNFDHLI